MASKTSIISHAFSLLGKEPVNDVNSTPLVQAVSSLYDTMYSSTLSHPWTFAMQIGYQLSRLNVTTGVDEWQYVYQIPSDLIAAWNVRPNVRFNRFEDKIYANVNKLYLDYTKSVSEDKLPPFVAETLEYLTAAKCAMLITGDKDLAKSFQQVSTNMLAAAMSRDAQGQSSSYFYSQPLFVVHKT